MSGLIGYFKAEPSDYVLVYRGEKIVKQGSGLSFFYWRPNTSIVLIPTNTIDAPFIFNESTGNFQSIIVQGQLTYRILQPKQTASILNFSINPHTCKYLSGDPDKLSQRIINAVQKNTRSELFKLSLEEALHSSTEIAANVLEQTKKDNTLADMGVDIVSIYFNSVRPTPEMAKALEAEYREGLQTKADQAIYTRRAMAVEKEQQIKENELNTQITLEQKRKELVELEGQNSSKQAEYEAQSIGIKLEPFKALEPRLVLALAIKAMGDNAEKIGTVSITPEILAQLLTKV